MKIFRHLSRISIVGAITALLALGTGCLGGGLNEGDATANAVTAGSAPERVFIGVADPLQCPYGGTAILNFRDTNDNGAFDSGEKVLSSSLVCNGTRGVAGATGAQGTAGIGAGIQVASAASASCPAGGSVLTTFADANNNTQRESGEAITSVTTICNGVSGTNGANGSNGSNGSNGANGLSAHITETPASSAACPAGGIVYATYLGSALESTATVCSGTNGSNALFASGAVGLAVGGKAYSACHHDYLYIAGVNASAGWLLFRHQKNGASDQGIGSTGFNVWNVDISDFLLVSEVGNVSYCQLQWDPSAKILSYRVLDNSDGLAGATGQINF